MSSTPRIALIHATPLAIDPIVDAFKTHWPDCALQNLLDDTLSQDLAARGSIDDAMIERFRTLGGYSVDAGADGILFTCSAFGKAIEIVADELSPLPVLKPNEAMFDEAIGAGGSVALLATFAPSIPSMREEFETMSNGHDIALSCHIVENAMPALAEGDGPRHDALIAETASGIPAPGAIMLAQFSMARAASAVATATGLPVLTSTVSAVHALKARIA